MDHAIYGEEGKVKIASGLNMTRSLTYELLLNAARFKAPPGELECYNCRTSVQKRSAFSVKCRERTVLMPF